MTPAQKHIVKAHALLLNAAASDSFKLLSIEDFVAVMDAGATLEKVVNSIQTQKKGSVK